MESTFKPLGKVVLQGIHIRIKSAFLHPTSREFNLISRSSITRLKRLTTFLGNYCCLEETLTFFLIASTDMDVLTTGQAEVQRVHQKLNFLIHLFGQNASLMSEVTEK